MITIKFTKQELAHLWNSWDSCFWCIENKKDCKLCSSISKKIDMACKREKV
jgi:hypothetical protein